MLENPTEGFYVSPMASDNVLSDLCCNSSGNRVVRLRCVGSKERQQGSFENRTRGKRLGECSNWHLIMLPVQLGAPTILVNNAGVMSGKLILDLEEKDVTR